MARFISPLIVISVVGVVILIGCKHETEEWGQAHEGTDSDLIRSLFRREVPEIVEGIVEIKAIARDAGHRTKVAVHSPDPKIDAVGACVGVKASRINRIVEELGGENIDLVRWNSSAQVFITNALRPAEVSDIALCLELSRATVVVPDDEMALAIGEDGQNVRLAAGLTGWDLDLVIPDEFNTQVDLLENTVLQVRGADSKTVGSLLAMGLVDVSSVAEVGPDPLVKELRLDRELAERIVACCAAEAKKVQEVWEKLKLE